MEEKTPPSNEGSSRDLKKYQEITTRKVDKKEIMEHMTAIHPHFNLNCIAYNVNANVKTAQDSNPVSATSADTFVYEEELFLDPQYSIKWVNLNSITPEKAPKIARRRKRAQTERNAKKEATEVQKTEAENQNIQENNQIDK